MRIRFATVFDRFSNLGAWIAVAGTFLLVGGLAWDVSIHEASPGLAAHEGVFTIDNPAHVVFLAGIGLIVVGMLGFLGGQVRAARSTRRARFVSVTAVATALALTAAVGATSAVQTQLSSASSDVTAAHVHGVAGAVAHHAKASAPGVPVDPRGRPGTCARSGDARGVRDRIRDPEPHGVDARVRALPYAAKFNPNVLVNAQNDVGKIFAVPTQAYAMGRCRSPVRRMPPAGR
jgi:hypothetical protein